MIQFFNRWLHGRKKQSKIFRLPFIRRGQSHAPQQNLVNYLTQSSVRGSRLKKSRLPRINRSHIQSLVIFCILGIIGWMAYESAVALIVFGD